MGKRAGRVHRGLSRGGRDGGGDVGFAVCFRGGIFSAFSGNHIFFSNSCTSTRPLAARNPDSSRRRIGEGAPRVSQYAHRDLAATYPDQVYRLVCSHLRNMACHQLISKNEVHSPSLSHVLSDIIGCFKLRERQLPILARQSTTVDIRKRDIEACDLNPQIPAWRCNADLWTGP